MESFQDPAVVAAIKDNFRKEVFRNRQADVAKEIYKKINLKSKKFYKINTNCFITKEPIKIAIRHSQCKSFQCFYDLNQFIENQLIQFKRDLWELDHQPKDQITSSLNEPKKRIVSFPRCGNCPNTLYEVKDYFYDVNTTYYLDKARQKIEDFDDLIDIDEIEFGYHPDHGYIVQYIDQDSENFGEKIFLRDNHVSNKSNQSSINNSQSSINNSQKLKQKKIAKNSNEIEPLNTFHKQIQETMKLQALLWNQTKRENKHIQINHQEIIDDIKESLQSNYQLVPSQQEEINDWSKLFTFCFQEFEKQQDAIFLYFPHLDKWYCSLIQTVPNQKFKKQFATTFVKGYNSQTQTNCVYVIGGTVQGQQEVTNHVYEIPLFKKSPDEIDHKKVIIQANQLPNLPEPRALSQPIFCKNENSLYVLGGYIDYKTVKQTIYKLNLNKLQYNNININNYNNNQNAWEQLPLQIPLPLILPTTIQTENNLLIFGGYSQGPTSEFDLQNRKIWNLDLNSLQLTPLPQQFPDIEKIHVNIQINSPSAVGFLEPNNQDIITFGGRNSQNIGKNSLQKENSSYRDCFANYFNLVSGNYCIEQIAVQDGNGKNQEKQQGLEDSNQQDQNFVFYNNAYFLAYAINNKLKILKYQIAATPVSQLNEYDIDKITK
ncbi:hypothetical protein PPERSA_09215 [Pseudocohnilembus persalinus]|uniref:Uncharacterized protein n=1 Tax=Pseudocohnilembus persalinus TaxID=266149 RepID=A0A0V0R4C9_PSEPJ|nr:hypothetical protein PPERSA_09215 [Pseudocohnilembus persalinus]|eukprot:KRX09331.1 hypothetical protein PPERSA_09215 [Pseudocohnilembus persalinus]